MATLRVIAKRLSVSNNYFYPLSLYRQILKTSLNKPLSCILNIIIILLVLWLQQKLVQYGYLKVGDYKEMVYDELIFQTVAELQKNWERPTDVVQNTNISTVVVNAEDKTTQDTSIAQTE